MQGTVVHLQDARLATRAKISKGEIDWAKMTLEGQGVEEGQIDSSGSQQSNMAQIDLMLYRFIEHRQLFEFIEVYKVYLKGDQKLTEAPENLGGKTFLHLAVEHSATEIVSYLLLDAKVDPNVLSHNSQMGVLHVAVSFQRNDLIDLILMSERTDINLMSSLHGTPLHLACKIGNLKIVQQLLINGADIFLKSLKNGKLAKDSGDKEATRDGTETKNVNFLFVFKLKTLGNSGRLGASMGEVGPSGPWKTAMTPTAAKLFGESSKNPSHTHTHTRLRVRYTIALG